MIPEPAIYRGYLRHRRFRPAAHEFRYSLHMAFLDIDHIPETMTRSFATAYNRFAWASFYQRDHFGDPSLPLRARLESAARAEGLELPGGPIFLLTNLRYFGYCFNPISLFYFYDRSGGISLLMAEVNSTFGESRNYWLTSANRQPSTNSMRFLCPKAMHVSPFMPMHLDYEFVLTPPTETLVAHMNTLDGPVNHRAPLFDATLTLNRYAWTSANLTRALAAQPFMTAKVIGAIHWEALRLWAKRVPVFTHPGRIPQAPPKEAPRT